jgi:uncharacterized protein (TIGR00730 family)
MTLKRLTVFCGSGVGADPAYRQSAVMLGKAMADREIELVYGGAQIGIMGAVADAVLAAQGKVIGVIPKFLSGKEIAHAGLTEMIVVNTMHERKALMNQLCDGFITLPGGFGTMEELFEVLTWAQLGLHSKPVALLNVNGYYDQLIAMVSTMLKRDFIKQENQTMFLVSDNIEDLLEMMENYVPPAVPQWITEETT